MGHYPWYSNIHFHDTTPHDRGRNFKEIFPWLKTDIPKITESIAVSSFGEVLDNTLGIPIFSFMIPLHMFADEIPKKFSPDFKQTFQKLPNTFSHNNFISNEWKFNVLQ